jgi:Tol biopolymer transport system component
MRAVDPAWAPDGNRLAFTNTVVVSGGVYVVSASGGTPIRVTNQSTDGGPAWSPDAQTIAFVRNQNRFDRIFVVNVDGSGLRVLTDANVHAQDPEWSPDGSRLVFSDGFDIYVVNANGTGLRRLTGRDTPGELRGGRWPAWSPDGSTIVMARVDSIGLIQADGTGNRQLVGGFREVWEIAWSPDGRRIAFVNDPAGTFQEELYVMNADGSGVTRLNVDTETTLDWGRQGAAPPPVAGVSVNVAPVSGAVRVRLRGTNRFVPLARLRNIPVGSEFDVTRGRVRLTSAAGSGRTQTAVFYQGRAIVRQRRPPRRPRAQSPLTDLVLSARLVCPRRSSAGATAPRPPRVRRLWGNGKGRFRTLGRYSGATVRGTIWLTEDRCDGTLTRVVRGRVAVEDFGRRRTVVVRAGQSYLARARRR